MTSRQDSGRSTISRSRMRRKESSGIGMIIQPLVAALTPATAPPESWRSTGVLGIALRRSPRLRAAIRRAADWSRLRRLTDSGSEGLCDLLGDSSGMGIVKVVGNEDGLDLPLGLADL